MAGNIGVSKENPLWDQPRGIETLRLHYQIAIEEIGNLRVAKAIVTRKCKNQRAEIERLMNVNRSLKGTISTLYKKMAEMKQYEVFNV